MRSRPAATLALVTALAAPYVGAAQTPVGAPSAARPAGVEVYENWPPEAAWVSVAQRVSLICAPAAVAVAEYDADEAAVTASV